MYVRPPAFRDELSPVPPSPCAVSPKLPSMPAIPSARDFRDTSATVVHRGDANMCSYIHRRVVLGYSTTERLSGETLHACATVNPF